MSKFNLENQEIIVGSSVLASKHKNFDRISFAVSHMDENKAYTEFLIQNKIDDNNYKVLNNFKKSFLDYRKNWKTFPDNLYRSNVSDFNKTDFDIQGPLCVDIEVAAICDLACPHCFREYILTPDKLMNFDLYKKIINEIQSLGVPSIKLNWRGEPLLNSKIDEYILYAKQKGILEVAINTNATNLNEKMSQKLIKSGLDLIIYSFDGGSKKTYEKMRPGRFKKNKFEDVLKNITQFSSTRKKMKSLFPTTKIQMVLTDETREEINSFYGLFNDIVDEVTVTPYSERGGKLEDLKTSQKNKILDYLKKNDLKEDTPYIVNANGKISISTKRKPCAQIFQRLMITYDGRVAMCCMDWGAQHCVGYVDNSGFDVDKTLNDLKKKINSNKKGFELLKNAAYPKKYNEPNNKVQTIKEIWNGSEINHVRNMHKKEQVNNIEICKKCDFTDTYVWDEID